MNDKLQTISQALGTSTKIRKVGPKKVSGKAKRLKEKYNLTISEYKSMLTEQEYRCAGCRTMRRSLPHNWRS
jgi:hypothetical protein